MNEQFLTATSTISNKKYDDWLINELIEYVRNAPLEIDAVHNIPLIIKEYERRKTSWRRFKDFIINL